MILMLLIATCQYLELGFAIGVFAGYASTIFMLVSASVMAIKEKKKKTKYSKEILYVIFVGINLSIMVIGSIVALLCTGTELCFIVGYFAMALFGLMAICGLCKFLFPILLGLF